MKARFRNRANCWAKRRTRQRTSRAVAATRIVIKLTTPAMAALLPKPSSANFLDTNPICLGALWFLILGGAALRDNWSTYNRAVNGLMSAAPITALKLRLDRKSTRL